MGTRFNYAKATGYKTLEQLDDAVHAGERLEQRLVHLVELRVSQINGCAYCINQHWKDLRSGGEPDLRLYELSAWRVTPYYTPRERAALAWAEADTLLAPDRVPDEEYAQASAVFDEGELADLTLVVALINTWNRLSVSSRSLPSGHESLESAGSAPAIGAR
jgi:AhpD family alkylhydroperoxidase